MTTEFEKTHGFARANINITNWRLSPYSRWTFQNTREIVPTTQIACAAETAETAPVSSSLLDAPLDTGFAAAPTARTFLKNAHADSFVMMRRGEIIAEHYEPHADINRSHIVFSISKSLTAMVASVLERNGVLDPAKPVTYYLPEAAGSAYADCSVRDVLDMRVSLDFEESYLSKDSAFARYRRSTLWNPAEPGTPSETLNEFLMTLPKGEQPHGGRFFYASPNSDLLGFLIERASGRRFAGVMSEVLWKPMGAKNHGTITVDGIGSPRTAGGISVTARDLARVGELVRTGGSVGGKQVIAESWITDMTTAGSHQAWLDAKGNLFPNGRYRSKWYQTGESDGAYCAIGIHGQWLYIDPEHETVLVKLSSHTDPLGDEMDYDMLTFFQAMCRLTA